MEERYSRNIPAVSEEDMRKLKSSRAFVAGCGGLGGFIIEYLARMGVGAITVVDGDEFSESNLNRQLLSKVSNMGVNKALTAAERIKDINPDVSVRAVPEFLTKENAASLLADADVVMDALDNVSSRHILEDAAARSAAGIFRSCLCRRDRGCCISCIRKAPQPEPKPRCRSLRLCAQPCRPPWQSGICADVPLSRTQIFL